MDTTANEKASQIDLKERPGTFVPRLRVVEYVRAPLFASSSKVYNFCIGKTKDALYPRECGKRLRGGGQRYFTKCPPR